MGARSQPSTTVLIVGGGIGGLFCALECHRKRLIPKVLECHPSASPAGDFLTVGPSALRALASSSTRLATLIDLSSFSPSVSWYTATGEVIAADRSLHANLGHIINRSTLHAALLDVVKEAGIDVLFDSRVKKYLEDDDVGGVELEDGRTMYADVVVAADGVNSSSWEIVTGREPQWYSSGTAIFRGTLPGHIAKESPVLQKTWSLQDDEMSFVLGSDNHSVMIATPEAVGLNWVYTIPSSETRAISFDESREQLLVSGMLDPATNEVVRLMPKDNLVNWALPWRDLEENWVSPNGRVVQIGDAAHQLLPTSVNGATQAMEDAASLAACLLVAQEHSYRPADAIPLAARVHNRLRVDRISRIQQLGFDRKHAYHNIDTEAAKKDPSMLHNGPPGWLADHDPVPYVLDNFDLCAKSLNGSAPFSNTNVPPGYEHKSKSSERTDSGISVPQEILLRSEDAECSDAATSPSGEEVCSSKTIERSDSGISISPEDILKL